MKHIFTQCCILLAALFTTTLSALGARETLQTIDFSTWADQNICAEQVQDTVNGIIFLSKLNSGSTLPYIISGGVLTYCNNNMSSNSYYIGIPVTGVNEKLYVTVYNGSTTTQFKYVWKADATTFSTAIGSSGSNSTKGAPSTATIATDKDKGYLYIGRYGSSIDMTKVTKIVIETEEGSAAATHTVTFMKNDGSDVSTTQASIADNTPTALKSISAIGWTRSGYVFAGWAESPSGAVSKADAAHVTLTGDMTLYAQWVPVYAITSAPHAHGTFTVKKGDNIVSEAEEGASILLTSFPDDGYQFDAWTITRTSDDADITSTVLVGNTLTMPGYPVTVTASYSLFEPTCPDFSFRYYNGEWHTLACFEQIDGTLWMTDEVSLPSSTKFYVGIPSTAYGAHSVVKNAAGNLKYWPDDASKFSYNPEVYQSAGARGRFRIYSDSGDENYYLSFFPTSYSLQFGTGTTTAHGTWSNTQSLYFSPVSTAYDETEWLTPLTKLTAEQISNKIWVGFTTLESYTPAPRSHVESLLGLRTKKGASGWVDGGLNASFAGVKGRFRMYANSHDNNWYVMFVPHYGITYRAHYPVGASPVDTYSDVISTESSGTIILPPAPLAPNGYTFRCWTLAEDGSGVELMPGGNYDLNHPTGQTTLYAQWDAVSCVSYDYSTHYDGAVYTNPAGATAVSGSSKTLPNPMSFGTAVGVTSVVLNGGKYDGNGTYSDAYIKMPSSSSLVITLAPGYQADLHIKAGGKSSDRTITVTNGVRKFAVKTSGYSTTEDAFEERVLTLREGINTITVNGDTYISAFILCAELADPACFDLDIIATSGTLSAGATAIAGQATVVGSGAALVSGNASVDMSFEENGLRFGSGQVVEVQMPTGSCLGIGTVIEITGYSGGSNRGFKLYTTDNSSACTFLSSASGFFTARYTFTSDDPWLDASSFYLMRATSDGTHLRSISIYNCGTPCTEATPTIAITSGSAEKCPDASVTLAVSGGEPGAAIRWFRDGVLIPGETAATLTTIAAGEYTATTTNLCSRTSNSITISNLTASDVEAVYSEYYVKQDRITPAIPVFYAPGVTSWSVSPAIAGCTFEKTAGDTIYLKGSPASVSSATDQILTLTYDLGCGPATETMTLHLLPPTPQPTVAYIVEGTTNGGFTEGVNASQSTSHPLFTYLAAHGFTVTACNEYSTTNEKAIAQYYSQYDLVLITDYPSTQKKDGGKSYGNALGVLVDKVPLLTLETFMSGHANWSKVGLNANPKTPEAAGSKTHPKTMTLLCPAHDIFYGAHEGYTMTVIKDDFSATGDGGPTTLQGFMATEAPEGMIFIATIDGGDFGTLISCCERQQVVEARMLMFGVNFKGSEYLTDDGKKGIKQMLDYLLRKNKHDVADCAEVFDNGITSAGTPRPGSGDHLWSNPKNWKDEVVPTSLKAIRVEQPCIVDVTNAHPSSIKLNKGTNYDGVVCNGTLTIRPTGALAVSSFIRIIQDADYATTFPIAASDLIIQADADHQGALALGSLQPTQATVEFYTKSNYSTAATWQYVGVPFSDMDAAVNYFRGAWMCNWLEAIPNANPQMNSWAYIDNNDRLEPFTGYAITQAAPKKYTITGNLVTGNDIRCDLSFTTTAQPAYKGLNLLANSWMAPIRLTDMTEDDFNNADATVYVYNTGSFTDWTASGEGTPTGTQTTTAGQYISIPVEASKDWSGVADQLKSIPPMQGFFVKATGAEAYVDLSFTRLVYSDVSLTTQPKRMPRQLRTPLRVSVSGSRLADELFILPDEDYSEEFDNGYDATKMEGSELAPMLYASTPAGDLSVAAVPEIDQLLLGFRSGEDDSYTLLFEGVPAGYELHDLATSQVVSLTEGSTYTFAAAPNGTAAARFQLVKSNMPGIATDLSSVQVTPEGVLINNPCAQPLQTSVYDSAGRLLFTCETDEATTQYPLGTSLTSGVYLIVTHTESGIKTQKIVF